MLPRLSDTARTYLIIQRLKHFVSQYVCKQVPTPEPPPQSNSNASSRVCSDAEEEDYLVVGKKGGAAAAIPTMDKTFSVK